LNANMTPCPFVKFRTDGNAASRLNFDLLQVDDEILGWSTSAQSCRSGTMRDQRAEAGSRTKLAPSHKSLAKKL
jgi:hypothetical protein